MKNLKVNQKVSITTTSNKLFTGKVINLTEKSVMVKTAKTLKVFFDSEIKSIKA